jgi:hypothetical protein
VFLGETPRGNDYKKKHIVKHRSQTAIGGKLYHPAAFTFKQIFHSAFRSICVILITLKLPRVILLILFEEDIWA